MKNARRFLTSVVAFTLLLTSSGRPASASPLAETPIVFAIIGDYGKGSVEEADVAALVKSWNPQFIVTLGDNNYPTGSALEIDANIGQHYHEFIYPYQGGYGTGADVNRFFPALGNHDWMTDNAQPYLDYFALPGNERYYSFTRGSISFFILDSDPNEPDGTDASSPQAEWLRTSLAKSDSAFNLVIAHHAPYSSGQHGPNIYMQWPFKEWGADAVLSGHDHTYERLEINGLPYFVNGLGGSSIYAFDNLQPGSLVRYNADYGAMRVEMTANRLKFEFHNRAGQLQDSFVLNKTETLATTSDPLKDGWTLAMARNLNIGGASNSSSAVFLIGDDAANRQYRSILSFNTSPIPDNAVITGVTLKIRKQGLMGTDPFTTHGVLYVDVRKGAFSGNNALQLSDFQAHASQSAVGIIPNTPVNGWYSRKWGGGIFPYINKKGITQLRLRFSTDDNNNNIADYMNFFSGDHTNSNVRPILSVEYHLP